MKTALRAIGYSLAGVGAAAVIFGAWFVLVVVPSSMGRL